MLIPVVIFVACLGVGVGRVLAGCPIWLQGLSAALGMAVS